MQKDLSNYRKEYKKSELLEDNLPDNPIQLFQTWFYEVEKYGIDYEANAMNISTFGLDGYPKSRVVLLKKYTHEGFIFFTNYSSEKGKAIDANPKVCLSFYWSSLERQVIIKGSAEKVSEDISDNYFHSRPDGSKLGAIVSSQSDVINGREEMDFNLKKLEKEYENKVIPRPKDWGGYIVKPVSIEFWQGRPNRLHDRIRYTLDGIDWKIERLAP